MTRGARQIENIDAAQCRRSRLGSISIEQPEVPSVNYPLDGDAESFATKPGSNAPRP